MLTNVIISLWDSNSSSSSTVISVVLFDSTVSFIDCYLLHSDVSRTELSKEKS